MSTNSKYAKYSNHDPFFGDESQIDCKTVAIRKARKEHVCFGLTGKQDHVISSGQYYRHEKALVDRSFWGEYKLCLNCVQRSISGKF